MKAHGNQSGGLSKIIEIVCGWALGGGIVYVLFFVDLTGGGSLYAGLRQIILEETATEVESAPVKGYILPARTIDEQRKAEDRMLMVPQAPEQQTMVLVENPSRPKAAMTDAPTDKSAGKDWRPHISGQLRTFSVYGNGEESVAGAAGAARAASPAGASVRAAATPTVPESAYHAAGADAMPRPGIGDHVTRVANTSNDSLNNFR